MVSPLPLIEGTLLTNAGALYYTAPAKTSTLIKKLTIVNIHATDAHSVTVWLVKSGAGATSDPALLIDARPVGPLGTYDVTEAQNQVLAAGDSIWAKADDNVNLQIRASGVQIV